MNKNIPTHLKKIPQIFHSFASKSSIVIFSKINWLFKVNITLPLIGLLRNQNPTFHSLKCRHLEVNSAFQNRTCNASIRVSVHSFMRNFINKKIFLFIFCFGIATTVWTPSQSKYKHEAWNRNQMCDSQEKLLQFFEFSQVSSTR